MNNLSLVLYLADVLYTFRGVTILLLVVTWASYTLWWLWAKTDANNPYSWETQDSLDKKKAHRQMGFLPKNKWLWLSASLIFISILLPNRETFYLIAASEAGEAVVNTPEAKELLLDVREILDIQLEKLKQ